MDLGRARVVAVGERVRQGSMQPIYLEIALPDGERVTAIGKFPTRENRAPAESVVNEWVGCYAARMAGVQAPPCYIVEASPHVMLHLVEKHGITVSSHFGFASKVCEIDAIIYPTTLAAMTPEDLTRLYCFDMLFINADRTPNNPNCGQSKRRLFAYDFGSSLFSPGAATSGFDRYFFGPGMSDRATAHLCKEYLGPPELGRQVMDEIVERLCRSHWFASLNAKGLPRQLQDHLRLVEGYVDFVGRERNTICSQIVSTI